MMETEWISEFDQLIGDEGELVEDEEKEKQFLINYSVFMFTKCRDVIVSTLQEHGKKKPELAYLIQCLLNHVGDRATAMLWLLQGRSFWDAEIILRSATEAVCKIMFVCFTDDTEQEQRVNEFWNDLADMRRIKRSERIKPIISNGGEDNAKEFWLSLQVLSEEEELELRSKWPKQTRQRLEQKWSFFEMLFHIDKYLAQEGVKESVRILMLNYGSASHLIHADEMSLLLRKDREKREASERKKLEMAHMCGLLQNYIALPILVVSALCHAFDINDERTKDLAKTINPLLVVLENVSKDFYDSQEELANKIRMAQQSKSKPLVSTIR